MYQFGQRSLDNLATADEFLQDVARVAITIIDHTVLEAHRGQERQERMFRTGKSKLRWDESKHNKIPSLAIDVAPYPIDWADLAAFRYLAGVYVGIAAQMGRRIRWGGDWDMDGVLSDNRFNDLPHLELA